MIQRLRSEFFSHPPSRDTDGFPLPASPKELQTFDEAYFGKSSSSSSKGKHNSGGRSRSIPELLSLGSKLRFPSKPKFLERIITSAKKAGVKSGTNGLIQGDSAAGDSVNEVAADDTCARAVCSVEDHTDSDLPESLDGETDCSEGSITPTNSSITSSPPCHPRGTWSTPSSPLRSGIVQKRCENFQRLYNVVHDSPPLQRKSSLCHIKKGHQSTPTSPSIECKPICSPHDQGDNKFDRLIKSYYSISRDEKFAKTVMSRGYVRALVERINNTHCTLDGEESDVEDEDTCTDKDNVDLSEKTIETPLPKEKPPVKSPKPQLAKSAIENGKSKPKLTLPNAEKGENACLCRSGLQSANKSPVLKSSKKTSPCDNVKKPVVNGSCQCAEEDAGFNMEGGSVQPMSPAELFDSSWSESDMSFEDFSDESDTEDKLFETFEKKLEQTEIEDGPPRDKLYRIADELLKTERAYVEKLHLLHQVFHFRITMQNRTQNMLPPEAITQMFSNIESIFQFHHDFLLPQLEDRMSKWDQSPKIGDLMKKNAPFLKLYTDYVKNFDNAMNLINTWQEKSVKFANLIQEIQRMPECGSLSLQHHMLEPIQRVPRYEMLLKDYIKKLPSESPDHHDAQAALNLVTTAAKHSNEAMKKIEKFRKLLEIHQSLRGIDVDFISPTRELIREGSVTKISARSGEKQLRYIFLFNDMMLICSEPLLGTFRVRAQLDVEGMQVKDGDNLSIAHTFCVMSRQKTIELLDHESVGDGPSWYDTIEKVVDDFRLKKKLRVSKPDDTLESFQETMLPDSILGRRAPRWIPDDAATMCMRCQAGFSAFRRRHHCRACGWVVCGKCCRKAPLAYMQNKIERVCNKCYDVIVHPKSGTASSPDSEGGSPRRRGVLQVKASDPAVLSGYLYMSSDKGKSWVKRWFAVHDDFVMYSFRAHQDVSALTSMPLPGYIAEPVSAGDNVDRPNTFKVHHKHKKIYFFQTDHEKHLRKWINVLEKMVKLELPDDSQRLSSQSSVSNVSNISSNSGSGDMSENAAASDISSTHSNRSDCSKTSDENGISGKDNDSGIANSNENCSTSNTDNSEYIKDSTKS
ncbi:FYVE, RhoGEF and PH domain-containing protein 2-like isoform X1 [Haliotis asinina]|uniref:FYVE, RhoGEF and PH domain-containing protein 2-like isoform X1 n=2 Tax=Haliotis asinina TaxID=109174 RepID=UPI0035321F3A